MSLHHVTRAALAAALTLTGTLALAHDHVAIKDAYFRSAPPTAPTGAAFMMIENHRDVPVHLTGVSSDAAARVELHTHREGDNGVMQMIHVEEGFVIPAGETLHLRRGAEHVMFMGLAEPLAQGGTVSVTFTFEDLDDLTVEIPVDHAREDGGMDHGAMDHGTMHSN